MFLGADGVVPAAFDPVICLLLTGNFPGWTCASRGHYAMRWLALRSAEGGLMPTTFEPRNPRGGHLHTVVDQLAAYLYLVFISLFLISRRE